MKTTRLIDAEEFKTMIAKVAIAQGLLQSSKTLDAMFDLIDMQPTAYDPEEKSNELKEEFEKIVGEILYKTQSDFTLDELNIKPYSKRLCDIIK